jgi:hypothetical protein
MNIPCQNFKIDFLFSQWEHSANRSAFWRDMLTTFPEDDYCAAKYAQYDATEKILYLEIERRADLFPMPLLTDLINSGCSFYFNPKSIH